MVSKSLLGSSSARPLVWLFLISLVVRLALWGFVVAHDMPPRGDEGGYLRRALAAQQAIQAVLDGESLTLESTDRWYGGGRWGPLYPLVLALGFQASDQHVPTARLIVAVVGALTTPVVFALTRRISSRRAAWIAALLHIGYGGFVAFSHFLWSETFFMFLVLLTLLLAHSAEPGAPPGRVTRSAVWTGITLGLAGLVRPTILPFIILIPAWLAWRHRTTRWGAVAAGGALVACVLTLSPWLAWQNAMEGHFVPLATTGSLNLFRAQAPAHVSEADVVAYAKATDSDVDCVMRELAIAEIRKDPWGVLGRGLERSFRGLWKPETMVLAHLRLAVYPPVLPALVVIWFLVTLAVYLAIVAFAGFGFRLDLAKLGGSSHLLMAMVLSSLAFPILLRGGNARITLVNLALLLPLAGHGAAHLRQWSQVSRKTLSLILILALPVSILSTLPGGVGTTTGHYAGIAAAWNRSFGLPTRVLDPIELRGAFLVSPDVITVRPATAGYRLGQEARPEWSWSLDPELQRTSLLISAADAMEPPRLELHSRNLDETVELSPIRRDSWQQWQPTGLAGVDFRWLPAESVRKAPVFARGQTAPAQARPSQRPVIDVPQCRNRS